MVWIPRYYSHMSKGEFRDEALVLDSRSYRDRDLLLSLLSPSRGLIRGVARRARGGRAPKAAAAQVLSHIRFSAFQGAHAELAGIRDLDLIRSSFPLAGDLMTATASAAVAEIFLLFCPQGEPAPRRFRLGTAVLEALLAGVSPDGALAYTQLWILRLGGFLPRLNECAGCGSTLSTAAFSADSGPGMKCPTCSTSGLHLKSTDLNTLRQFIKAPPAEIMNTPSPVLTRWLDGIIREAAEGRMRALDFHRAHS